MIDFLNLKILSPYETILDEEIKKINFMDKHGNTTILPNHQDYVSSFEAHLLSCVNVEKKNFFVVVNDGVLVKTGRDIKLSVYSAIVAESLEELKEKVGGFQRRAINIKTDKERQIDDNLKILEDCLFG